MLSNHRYYYQILLFIIFTRGGDILYIIISNVCINTRPDADMIVRGDDNAVETFLANKNVDKEVAYKYSGKIVFIIYGTL